MSRPSWEEYFIEIAHSVASRSTCARKHVGCVLVYDKRIISAGYNGSVPGQPHCDDAGHDLVNDHCVRTVHAEVNAVVQAARAGVRTLGAVAYTNTYPCWPCFKVLLTAGIFQVVYDDAYRVDPRVQETAARAGLSVTKFEKEKINGEDVVVDLSAGVGSGDGEPSRTHGLPGGSETEAQGESGVSGRDSST